MIQFCLLCLLLIQKSCSQPMCAFIWLWFRQQVLVVVERFLHMQPHACSNNDRSFVYASLATHIGAVAFSACPGNYDKAIIATHDDFQRELRGKAHFPSNNKLIGTPLDFHLLHFAQSLRLLSYRKFVRWTAHHTSHTFMQHLGFCRIFDLICCEHMFSSLVFKPHLVEYEIVLFIHGLENMLSKTYAPFINVKIIKPFAATSNKRMCKRREYGNKSVFDELIYFPITYLLFHAISVSVDFVLLCL